MEEQKDENPVVGCDLDPKGEDFASENIESDQPTHIRN